MRVGLGFMKKEVHEWIDAGCATRLWLEPKRGPWEKFYPRVCRAKVGYTLHVLGYVVGWHTSIIFDPLHSGGLISHLRSFISNVWYVDIWWPLCNRIDRWRNPEVHRQQTRFFDACIKAIDEGYADPMPPPGFPAERFHGSILGERYFKRVDEILKQDG